MGQATSHTPFDFTVDTSLKTDRKCASTSLSMQKKGHNRTQKAPCPGKQEHLAYKKQKIQGKKGVSKRKILALYEDYLKKRVKETWPIRGMGNRFFEEIKAKGYRGSLSAVKKFLHGVRKEGDFPKEHSLSYYNDYLKKRLEEAQPNSVSAKTLFHEITTKGYRGSFSALEKFLWVIRKNTKVPKEASIQFHKKYLIKRVKEAYPKYPLGTRLFEEIRAQGYRGSINTLQGFLSMLRKKEKKPSEKLSKASVEFHKDYLTNRLEETYPNYVSGKELFKEIKAKGYQRSFRTLQGFLSVLRTQEERPSHADLTFHRDYLTKRLEETYPKCPSGQELFKEIRAKGYQGTFRTLQGFLSMLRKQTERPSQACLRFHKEHLSKRIKDALTNFVPAQKLFEETTDPELDKNDTPKQLNSASLVHRKVLSEASLQFHKDYLIKTLEETWPNSLSPKQLFEEIISRGYRGTCKEVEVFLMMISK